MYVVYRWLVCVCMYVPHIVSVLCYLHNFPFPPSFISVIPCPCYTHVYLRHVMYTRVSHTAHAPLYCCVLICSIVFCLDISGSQGELFILSDSRFACESIWPVHSSL